MLRDVEALSALTQLRSLDLTRTQIDSLAPLASCVALEQLWARACERLDDVLPALRLPNIQLIQI